MSPGEPAEVTRESRRKDVDSDYPVNRTFHLVIIGISLFLLSQFNP